MAEDGETNLSWKELYDFLKSKGYDVYSLGQHKGNCDSPYLVLRNNGSNLVYNVTDRQYEILIYYPADKYSEMEEFVDGVKLSMAELLPTVSMVDDETPHYLDDDVKAYMTSIIYRAPRVAKYTYTT